MTFLDILKEYDKEREIIYPSDYYNDMRKKLLLAFECLGLFDLTIFKAENGKDYDFFETSKEYIFHLLKSETSPLFRNICMSTNTPKLTELQKVFIAGD